MNPLASRGFFALLDLNVILLTVIIAHEVDSGRVAQRENRIAEHDDKARL
ncbi:hypothetical protein G6O69_09360 [Pseudenhygromyxa sp. WMMC2535]|nr:hypothetical protein [Pseudenhygromyxa sp. WMMC2535]NVB38039.1 hypothetical protein [Pseudenhygromyxa sp. WMMC2535]